jgi:indole-3-glycerol phosphate synthase
MMGDLLQAVVAAARRSAEEREKAGGWIAIERALDGRKPTADRFRRALDAPGIRVIAECKRRSPSRGVLRAKYHPVSIAASYERAGAAAISVLTEPTFFDGSLDHLRDVVGAVSVPLLRKDFVVTEYQVAEAAAAGASAVLLIVAALERGELDKLMRSVTRFGLAALVEVHDPEELAVALDAGADIVGVNSRNLRTLEVHQDVLDRLAPEIPDAAIAVAESGLRSADDLGRLSASGYDAFLIGERLMVEPDPGAALAGLLRSAATGN